MKNVKQIIEVSIAQAMQILMAIKGHPFTGIELFIEATLVGGKRTLDLFDGKVYKHSRYVFAINRGWDRAIEIACDELGIDFANWTPEPHLYADHISGNILTHRADLSLPLNSADRRNYAQFLLHSGCVIETNYFDNQLRPLTIDQVKPYLRDNSSAKQTALGIAKADQKRVINPSMKSIKSFSANGCEYRIIAE